MPHYYAEPQWYPFPDTAPKDGTKILVAGIWKPFDILKGGEPIMVFARWSTLMSNGTGYKWYADELLSLDNYNVEWKKWSYHPEFPENL